MRHKAPLFTALAAAIGTALTVLAPMPSGALAGDHPVALSPAEPALGATFEASGDGCIEDVTPGSMNVDVQQLLSGRNTTGSSTTAGDGSWTADWLADWGDGPGWYQVLGNCAGTSGLGQWASDIFFVNDGTPVIDVVLHETDGESGPGWYIEGTGCSTGGIARFLAFDASDDEVRNLDALGQADGTFSAYYAYDGAPEASWRWIGACTVDERETALYEVASDSSGGGTTTTTTSVPGGPTTAPPATVPAAAPAVAVKAAPHVTG